MHEINAVLHEGCRANASRSIGVLGCSIAAIAVEAFGDRRPSEPAGGLVHGTVNYDGALDIHDNVVYDWENRPIDGRAHQVNFVNNYYRPAS